MRNRLPETYEAKAGETRFQAAVVLELVGAKGRGIIRRKDNELQAVLDLINDRGRLSVFVYHADPAKDDSLGCLATCIQQDLDGQTDVASQAEYLEAITNFARK